jgi:hypothetical protein
MEDLSIDSSYIPTGHRASSLGFSIGNPSTLIHVETDQNAFASVLDETPNTPSLGLSDHVLPECLLQSQPQYPLYDSSGESDCEDITENFDNRLIEMGYNGQSRVVIGERSLPGFRLHLPVEAMGVRRRGHRMNEINSILTFYISISTLLMFVLLHVSPYHLSVFLYVSRCVLVMIDYSLSLLSDPNKNRCRYIPRQLPP